MPLGCDSFKRIHIVSRVLVASKSLICSIFLTLWSQELVRGLLSSLWSSKCGLFKFLGNCRTVVFARHHETHFNCYWLRLKLLTDFYISPEEPLKINGGILKHRDNNQKPKHMICHYWGPIWDHGFLHGILLSCFHSKIYRKKSFRHFCQ